MKQLTTLISALFFLLIGISHAWALPACPSSGYFDNCYGTYVWEDGQKYVGDWKDNTLHGQGTSIFPSGNKYVGEYKDGKRHGQGTFTWKDGGKYIGGYKAGKKHGQGSYTFADGSEWDGAWENDNLNGYAITFYADGSINKEGIFKDDKFLSTFPKCVGSYSVNTWTNCFGTYIYTNGVYVGAWKNGKRNGQGTYTYASGGKYTGGYRDDEKHGQGVNTQANGNKYVGEHKDGKRHGQGTYNWKDGRIWVGEWQNDELSGYAITYDASGSINQEGIFKDGKFLYAQNRSSNNTQIAQQTCNDDPTYCTVAQLCSKASTFSGGKKVWRTTFATRKYVEEAKNNGLSCNVPAEIKVEKPKLDLKKTYKVASGTGFYVSNAGHLITNDHVVDGCENIKIQSTDTDINTVILATDPKNDLALLKASHMPSIYFSISNNDPEELQDVIVAGYPFGDAFSSTIKFTQGVVSSLAGIGNDYSQFQIDAAIQPGNSGGPIVDMYGNMIGVAVSKLSYKKILKDYGVVPENTNFGIKASAVRNLMVANNIKVKSPQSKTVTTSEKVKSIKAATVHLTCWMTVAQIDKMRKAENGKVLFKKFTD